jgi:drug/metabolite transporter (DMT)-like permease
MSSPKGKTGSMGVLSSGAGLALLSALLFGGSTPLAKLLLGGIDPWMLAGLLYLGSGLGLLAVKALVGVFGSGTRSEAGIRGGGWLWLALATLSGGVIGPVLLMVGLAHTTATTAALLLNLEGVLTALLAWFVFWENFDRRIALGMAAIVAGGLVLSWGGSLNVRAVLGPLMIVGACLAWAVDNNLTRKVSQADPVQIALLKGCVAGTVNVVIAFALGSVLPPLGALGAALVVGFVGYGVSLVLFVVALRHIGTARTGAYFSLAPFFGGVVAVLVLREPVTIQIAVAGSLMALGVWLHLTERHEHEHGHEKMAHEHRHVHDEHHQHSHDGTEAGGEPHSHWHVHAELRHSHAHFPDIHHRHEH